MAPQSYKAEGSGQLLQLTRSIGKGGEGSVWAIDRPGYVAKIYHAAAYPDRDKLEKLRFMVQNQLTLAQPNGPINIAWPAELVSDGRSVVGFLMPSFPDSFKLFDVLSAAGRLKTAPELSFRHLLFLARNIAAAFEVVHGSGHIVGDVNPYNVLVRRDGSVCLIDTDSFGLHDRQRNKTYHKPMAQWEYQAPECHQGKVPSESIEPHRDSFSLAVLVFYLLFGRHPTAGRWVGGPPTPEQSEKIREGNLLFAIGSKVQAPPSMPDAAVLSPLVVELFERAFVSRGPEVLQRPSAAEWRMALETSLLTLMQCSTSAAHHYDIGWSSSRGCPWCALSANRLNYFPSRPGPAPDPAGFFAAQVERAVQSGNARAVRTLWLDPRRDTCLPPSVRQRLDQRANELNQQAMALQSFLESLRARPQDARFLADRWDPKLDSSEIARTITFRGRSIGEIARQAKAGAIPAYSLPSAAPAPAARPSPSPDRASPAPAPPASRGVLTPAPRRPAPPPTLPPATRPGAPPGPPLRSKQGAKPSGSLWKRVDERTKRVLDWFLGF